MGAPRYLEIKNRLLEEIEKQPPKSPILSERELAIQYGASRMTVRRAVDELVVEGFLYRNGNKGTFVAARNTIKKNTATGSILAEEPESTMIYFNIKKIPEIAPFLDILEDEAILRIVRVNHIGERLLSVEEIYYVRSLISDDDINDLKHLLDLNGFVKQGTITQRFVPMLLPAHYATQLELAPGTPIIMVESLIRSRSGVPVIYVKTYNNPYENAIEITY